jgi:hypothetical protein
MYITMKHSLQLFFILIVVLSCEELNTPHADSFDESFNFKLKRSGRFLCFDEEDDIRFHHFTLN